MFLAKLVETFQKKRDIKTYLLLDSKTEVLKNSWIILQFGLHGPSSFGISMNSLKCMQNFALMSIFYHLLSFQSICSPKQIKHHQIIQKVLVGRERTKTSAFYTNVYLKKTHLYLLHYCPFIIHIGSTSVPLYTLPISTSNFFHRSISLLDMLCFLESKV